MILEKRGHAGDTFTDLWRITNIKSFGLTAGISSPWNLKNKMKKTVDKMVGDTERQNVSLL
jgi:hypothetical protein